MFQWVADPLSKIAGRGGRGGSVENFVKKNTLNVCYGHNTTLRSHCDPRTELLSDCPCSAPCKLSNCPCSDPYHCSEMCIVATHATHAQTKIGATTTRRRHAKRHGDPRAHTPTHTHKCAQRHVCLPSTSPRALADTHSPLIACAARAGYPHRMSRCPWDVPGMVCSRSDARQGGAACHNARARRACVQSARG